MRACVCVFISNTAAGPRRVHGQGVCVCVRACARARARVCVRACVRAFHCVRVRACVRVCRINPAVRDIDGFTADDVTLEGYDPHPKIAMDMAV